jgi:hypothetical protein
MKTYTRTAMILVGTAFLGAAIAMAGCSSPKSTVKKPPSPAAVSTATAAPNAKQAMALATPKANKAETAAITWLKGQGFSNYTAASGRVVYADNVELTYLKTGGGKFILSVDNNTNKVTLKSGTP